MNECLVARTSQLGQHTHTHTYTPRLSDDRISEQHHINNRCSKTGWMLWGEEQRSGSRAPPLTGQQSNFLFLLTSDTLLPPFSVYSLAQMTQEMSLMATGSGGSAVASFNQSGTPAAGWPTASPASSGQTLSTQLWK